jgi:hypothetical protein
VKGVFSSYVSLTTDGDYLAVRGDEVPVPLAVRPPEKLEFHRCVFRGCDVQPTPAAS